MQFRWILVWAWVSGGGVVSTLGAAEPVKLQSVSALAIGPKETLFVGDPVAGAVHAIELPIQSAPPMAAPAVSIPQLSQAIAKLLDTTAANITLHDVKAVPQTGKIVLAVSRGQGPSAQPQLLMYNHGELKLLATESLRGSKFSLPNATTKNRMEAITSMAFVEGKLIVAGLSNEEFASTLRVIPFPFPVAGDAAAIEVYHGAHGRYETNAPVRTFAPYKIQGADMLMAAYTCTPLVKVPVDQLKHGQKVKGTTIAELGNRNRPLDMIFYTKDDEDFLLMANSARGVMKIPAKSFATAEAIEEPVRGGGTKGVPFETLKDWVGVLQLDRYDATRALVVVQEADRSLTLKTMLLP